MQETSPPMITSAKNCTKKTPNKNINKKNGQIEP